MLLLLRKSWTVFIYATIISIESIIIEYLTSHFSLFQISSILLSSSSITLSGLMLLMATVFYFKRKREVFSLFTKSCKNLLLAAIFLAIGVFTWYDSINRIGASKEALIAGPLEIVMIIIFARIFIRERLNRLHSIGMSLAIIGFLLAIASDAFIEENYNINTTSISDNPLSLSTFSQNPIITFGDLEAIISAIGFAIGVLFLTKLVLKHSPLTVAGSSMFVSGILIFVFMISSVLFYEFGIISNEVFSFYLGQHQQEQSSFLTFIIIILLFSLLPFIGSLSYATGLHRIGASLTATIGSSGILIILVMQALLDKMGFPVNLPDNLVLAFLGGIIGFIGIYIIHMRDYSLNQIENGNS